MASTSTYLFVIFILIKTLTSTGSTQPKDSITCTDSSMTECPFSDPEYDPIRDLLKATKSSDNDLNKCSDCEAIDPVFDPAYNMKEICKQSILLEEHLIHRSKRCRDCITKHFLHIIGLAEEAAALCTIALQNYPMLIESIEVYRRLFDDWLNAYKRKGIDSDGDYCSISGKLRKQRKILIDIYFYQENYGSNKVNK